MKNVVFFAGIALSFSIINAGEQVSRGPRFVLFAKGANVANAKIDRIVQADTMITGGQHLPTADLERLIIAATSASARSNAQFIIAEDGSQVDKLQIGEMTVGQTIINQSPVPGRGQRVQMAPQAASSPVVANQALYHADDQEGFDVDEAPAREITGGTYVQSPARFTFSNGSTL